MSFGAKFLVINVPLIKQPLSWGASSSSLIKAVSRATLSFGVGVLIIVDHLASTGRLYVPSANEASSKNPKGLLLFSSERIYVFLHTYLIINYIFLQLCTYVFFYLFCILPHCINIIATTSKVTIPIFIFEICKFVKNH